MAESPNYLLGFGERLTEKIEPLRKPSTKRHAYTFGEARARLAPKIQQAVADLDELPDAACPNDESVAAITLHPSYLAKTFFPATLLRAVGLEALGSRPLQIIPDKGAKIPKKKAAEATHDKPVEPLTSPTAELYVSGSRSAFHRWAENFGRWTESMPGAEEIIRIEDVHSIALAEKIRPMRSKADNPTLEIVLHSGEAYVLEGFREYMEGLDVAVDLDRRIQVQGLCFLPLKVPRKLHADMAKFSFLRVAREMPSLRQLRPVGSTGLLRSSSDFPVNTPLLDPLNKDLRVAVFDGGIPPDLLPKTLVRRRATMNIGEANPKYQAHGLGVTSAVLFGPFEKGQAASQPFASVDHYRVIDKNTAHDPQGQYFDVLNRITDVLKQNHYDFVNLSIGPDLPIEDDEVHVWTASLDEHFSHGKTLVTVAAGNSGEDDWDVGNARIQAPSDGVNVLCVGASDSRKTQWKRAPYSSIGPGRSPGIVKPDILAFGGSDGHPFWVLSATKKGHAVGTDGTSFASPVALHTAIGLRTVLGAVLQPLGLKALLIHHADDAGHQQREVGWGRIPSEIDSLILCPDGVVHILYQGELESGRYLRAKIPLPASGLSGNIRISATFCYATETDPQDPINYTRAGLEIAFRPNIEKFNETDYGLSKNPATKPFFSSKAYAPEEDLRRDSHKWEPCLKESKTFRASSLKDPVFDIHYNARRGGATDKTAKPIPYALVVTVEAKHMTDLYNKIALRYRTQLEALRPIIQIPIRATGR